MLNVYARLMKPANPEVALRLEGTILEPVIIWSQPKKKGLRH
jgi:hypothetical protein